MADGARARRAAALLMVAAMGLYAANDALVKASAPDLPPGQLLALRAAMACLVFAAIMRGPYPAWRRWLHWTVVLRCSLELAAAASSLFALARIPLATAAAVMMIAPVLATVASFAMHWEPWRGSRIAAVFCGLCGALLVLQPSAHDSQALAGGAWALVCAVSLALRDLLTRRLPSDLPSTGVAGMASAFVCLAGLAFGSVERWMAPAGPPIVFVTLAALCSALGNYALVRACRSAPPSLIAPWRYTLILWASALGFATWGERPGWLAVAGMALIAGGGAWTHLTGESAPRQRSSDA